MVNDAPQVHGWAALPEVIRRYQEAHDRRETDRALSAFTSDAVVHDDGREHRGHEEIRTWLSSLSTEFMPGCAPRPGSSRYCWW